MSVPPASGDRGGAAPGQPAASDALVGQLVADRYRVVALLGRGGMASVYRSHDVRLDRDVAIKVLAEPFARDPSFADRFLAEARAAASLSHPNLVHVYDSGAEGGLHYIVMELLERYRSLRSVLNERPRLSADEAIGIAADLLSGIQLVHRQGLVHCDVKPGNVMVGPGPTKLIDFGIARVANVASEEPTSLGSLHAMPPEQLHGDELTPASDVFAVGAVLYVSLTGRVPYPGDDPEEVAASQQRGVPLPPSAVVPDVSPALDRVVLQALDPVASRRFASAAAMSRALDAAAGARTAQSPTHHGARAAAAETRPRPTVRAPVRQARPRPARPERSTARRSIAPTLAVLVLAMLAFGGVGWLLTRDAQPVSGPGATSTPSAIPTLAEGMVRVPNTIGLSEAKAEARARDAHLNWTIRWEKTDAHAPGVYDQEPAAGEVVKSGSRFTMFAYRPAD